MDCPIRGIILNKPKNLDDNLILTDYEFGRYVGQVDMRFGVDVSLTNSIINQQ